MVFTELAYGLVHVRNRNQIEAIEADVVVDVENCVELVCVPQGYVARVLGMDDAVGEEEREDIPHQLHLENERCPREEVAHHRGREAYGLLFADVMPVQEDSEIILDRRPERVNDPEMQPFHMLRS